MEKDSKPISNFFNFWNSVAPIILEKLNHYKMLSKKFFWGELQGPGRRATEGK